MNRETILIRIAVVLFFGVLCYMGYTTGALIREKGLRFFWCGNSGCPTETK